MEEKIAALDIGDLLYFAILIIGGIYSWYKKTQEANQKTIKKTSSPTSTSSPEDNPIEDFLKQLTGKNQESIQKPIEQVQEETIVQQKKTEFTFSDQLVDSKKYFIKNVNFEESEKINVVDTSINFYNGYENKNLKLRDLIIAESILNRPYK